MSVTTSSTTATVYVTASSEVTAYKSAEMTCWRFTFGCAVSRSLLASTTCSVGVTHNMLPALYVCVQWIQEVLLAIPSSLLFCMLVWVTVKLQGDFMLFWLAFFTCLLTSIGVSFTFAAVCPTIDFANGAVPSYGGTLLFFVGFLVPLNQIPAW